MFHWIALKPFVKNESNQATGAETQRNKEAERS